MNFKTITILSLSALIIASCSSKDPAVVAKAKTSGLNLPAGVEILQDDAATSASLAAVNMAAYNSPGTDYSNSVTEGFINGGSWQEPMNMADMLVCIMNASSHADLFNETYSGIVDMTICSKDSDRDEQGSDFAEVVMQSSRTSNNSNQVVNAFFKGADEVVEDVMTYDQFAVNVTMSEGASSANPFGLFTFNWNLDNAAAGDWSRGSLGFTEESATQVRVKFIEENKESGEFDQNQWAHGVLNKDGSGGKLKVSRVDNDGDIVIYNVNFNDKYANISIGGVESCKNLDEATMDLYAFDYDLYDNTTGALKDIQAGLPFFHGAGKALRGYAGTYSDYNDERKHFVWTEDGTEPEIIYNADDLSITYTVSYSDHDSDGDTPRIPVVSGMTFDDPIIITESFLDSLGNKKTDVLNYEGPGKLWGNPWAKPTGQQQYLPTYNIANGAQLTDTNGTIWRVKQRFTMKGLKDAAGKCTGLDVADSDVPYAKPALTAVTTTFSDMPNVTGKPRVIHGVKQF